MQFENPVTLFMAEHALVNIYDASVMNRWQDMCLWLSRNGVFYEQSDLVYFGYHALPMQLTMGEKDMVAFKLVFGL